MRLAQIIETMQESMGMHSVASTQCTTGYLKEALAYLLLLP